MWDPSIYNKQKQGYSGCHGGEIQTLTHAVALLSPGQTWNLVTVGVFMYLCRAFSGHSLNQAWHQKAEKLNTLTLVFILLWLNYVLVPLEVGIQSSCMKFTVAIRVLVDPPKDCPLKHWPYHVSPEVSLRSQRQEKLSASPPSRWGTAVCYLFIMLIIIFPLHSGYWWWSSRT